MQSDSQFICQVGSAPNMASYILMMGSYVNVEQTQFTGLH